MIDNSLSAPAVAIIDYGMGNIFSISRACEKVGLFPVVTSRDTEILKADAVILPGVGGFGVAIDELKKLDLIGVIKDFVQTQKPLLGICLGMQLLFTESEEFGKNKGLNIFSGSIKRFNPKSSKVKIPQIAWNKIIAPKHLSWEGSIYNGICNEAYMYFVHSFYAEVEDQSNIISLTNYGEMEYCSGIARGNVIGVQFHPEKSADNGLRIFHNFKDQILKKQEYDRV